MLILPSISPCYLKTGSVPHFPNLVSSNMFGKSQNHALNQADRLRRICPPKCSLSNNDVSQLSEVSKVDHLGHVSRRGALSGILAYVMLLATRNSVADEGKSTLGAGETVLLVGASGAIGQFVTRALESRGCKVRGLTRYPKEAREQLSSSVEWVGGDLLKDEILQDDAFFRKLVSGADRVSSLHGIDFIPSHVPPAQNDSQWPLPT